MAHKSDAQFQAEFDARSLADAAAIRADPTRLSAAQSAASGLVADANTEAAAAKKRATALAKLASLAKLPAAGTLTRGTVGPSKGPRRVLTR